MKYQSFTRRSPTLLQLLSPALMPALMPARMPARMPALVPALILASLLAMMLLTVGQAHATANDAAISTNSEQNQQAPNATKQAVKTFYLNLWAPDQVAPIEAKPVEFGISYQYLYTPESFEVQPSDGQQVIAFKFHSDLANRYQFRWITADQPQFVRFNKMKSHKMKVNIDTRASNQDQDIYFEVWVYDTLTGEVFMCDPKVKVIK